MDLNLLAHRRWNKKQKPPGNNSALPPRAPGAWVRSVKGSVFGETCQECSEIPPTTRLTTAK